MSKSKKVTLIVLASVSALFLVGFLAMFFTSTSTIASDYSWRSALGVVGEMYMLPFVDKTQVPNVAGMYDATQALALSISVLVLTGLVFISLVLGIVYVCIKKKPLMIIFTPVLLLAGFAGVDLLANGVVYFAIVQKANEVVPPLTAEALLFIFLIALGCAGFVLAYVTYVLGLVFAGKNQVEEEKAIEPVAEEAKDPEIVEEGEEFNFDAPAAEAPIVLVEPEEEKAAEPVAEEPAPEPEPEPEPKPEPEPARVEVNVNGNNNSSPAGLDPNSLASLLREVVRDIVRDEIARNNANQPQQPQQQPAGNQTITGATFGGPLVVQYFNGGINGVNPPCPAPAPQPAPAPAPVEEKKPEPVKEEPKPEPVKEEVKPEPVAEPAPEPVAEPVVEVKPAPLFTKKEPEEKPEAPKYERITFAERLLKSEKDIHELYNELKNEILSYGVKSRISAVGDTFRLHKKMYVRITVAGKSLKLYFALNPADYANTTLPIQDASNKEMYAEIPLVFKVKSGLSVRRCKELIQDVMEKDGLEQGEIGKVNWIKELKAEMAAEKKKAKEAE